MKRALVLSITALVFASACDPVIDDLHFDQAQVIALVPEEGPSSGGFQVVLSGSFCRAPQVTIDGLAPLDVHSAEPQQIIVTFPPHAIGDAEVRVDCDGVIAVSPIKFRYHADSIAIQTALIVPPVDTLLGFGDFDGDGVDDMAGLFFTGGVIKIFPGTRWNEFLPDPIVEVAGLSTTGNPRSALLDARDRDGDGRADLTVLEGASDGTSILRLYAKSSDDFRQPDLFMVTSTVAISAIAGADLDGDGLPDIVGAKEGLVIAFRTGVDAARQRVAFSSRTISPSFLKPFVADVNGDGVEDLVLGPEGGFPDFFFIFGSTSGAFELAELRTGSGFAQMIDFDGDPWPDVYEVDDGVIALQRGIGPAQFGPVESHPVHCDGCLSNIAPPSIGPFDLDEDGEPELVFQSVQDFLWVELETGKNAVIGDGRLLGAVRFGRESVPALIYEQDEVLKSAYALHPATSVGPDILRPTPPLIDNRGWTCFGDVGGKDVVFGPARGPQGRLLIREQRDVGGFGAERELTISGDTSAVLDALALCTPVHLAGDRGDFVIWLNTMMAPFLVRFEASGVVSATALPADASGADPTAYWALERPAGVGGAIVRATGSQTDNVEVYELKDGALARTAVATLSPQGRSALSAIFALIDGDDVVDALFRLGDTIDVFIGRRDAAGALTFQSRPVASGLENLTSFRLLDVDDDGDLDLVVETGVEPKRIFVFENDGSGQMRRTATIDRVVDMDAISACDLDGDRRPELVFVLENGLAVARRLRDGTYAPAQTFATAMKKPLPLPHFNGPCADLDGDGLNDLVLPDYAPITPHVFRNRSR